MKSLLVAPSSRRVAVVDVTCELLKERGLRVQRRRESGEASGMLVIDGGPIVINPNKAVMLARSTGDALLLLHTHGVPVSFHLLPPSIVRPVHFPSAEEMLPLQVHVADWRVLAVEGEAALSRMSHFRRQRMMEGACRAVYLLGLHFGCVDVLVMPGGRWCIAGVDPSPIVPAELARAYATGIARLVEGWHAGPDPQSDVVLGADPEFGLFTREGRLLYASSYVKHRGTVGYDRQSRASRGSHFPLVEVRPSPSPSPLVLVANIERALLTAQRLLPHRRTLWVAGSYPFGKFPTGGHIHFSGTSLTTPFMSALDQYLAVPTMLLEHRVRGRRRRYKYGGLGDVRRKEYGGFEYRTLPSWLVSPRVARGVLALAKVVAQEWHRLSPVFSWEIRIVRDFYRCRKARFRLYFPLLWRAVMATQTAKDYARELQNLAWAIQKGEQWHDEEDFKTQWWR